MREHYCIPIAGMTCVSCVGRITRVVRKLNGVESVRVDLASDSTTVLFDSSTTSLSAIAEAIRKVGYDADLQAAAPCASPGPRGPSDA